MLVFTLWLLVGMPIGGFAMYSLLMTGWRPAAAIAVGAIIWLGLLFNTWVAFGKGSN